MTAVVYGPGEGEQLRVGPNLLVIKATSEMTGGGFFLAETTLEPGVSGPPAHTHETLTDMFYVLDGALVLRVGDDEVEAPAGTFACAPPGTVHTFRNASDTARARFLNFNVPGGFEQYMRDLAAASASGTPPTPQEIGAIAARYDIRIA